MSSKVLKIASSMLLSLFSIHAFAATYNVSSISELTSRIASAVAGDVIIVQNGVYTTTGSISVSRVGTVANPILIRAETIGGVEITGSHGFSLNSGAAHVHIQGFKFTHTSGRNSINNGATFCRFTRNIFECPGDGNYLVISGHDSRIDRNEFRNKSTVGNMIDVRGSGSQIARRVWIHHNYFHDFTSAGENGAETIRFGLSGLSLSTGNGMIEHNLFLRCRGENEMISNKSSGNTYRYNTVLDSAGGEISQRHGNDCLYYGNYMRNTAGIRVYGDRHLIFGNYLESNTIGINMGNGDGDVYNGAALTAHDRPDDNVVVFNTFVNNNTHYQMGGRTGGLGSSNTVVANNIFQGGGSIGSISSSGPYTGSWSNNIRWQTSSAGNMPASAIVNVNPLLVKDASGAFHIQPGSPAINAGVAARDYYGTLLTFPYVNVDMDGQPRDASKDIGADEFSAAPVIAKILTTNDVGPFSVEGGLQFDFSAIPPSRSVLPGSDTAYTATVTALNGTTGVVALAVAGLPLGTSASFDPAVVTNSGSSTLTVTASNSAPFGTHTLTVSGVASNVIKSAPVTLTVGDFSISANPASRIVVAGSNATYTVTLNPNGLFSGTVTFDVSGLPDGASGSFNPPSLGGGGSTTLTVSTTESVDEGTFDLVIAGTGGSVGGSAITNVTLSISGDTAAPGNLIWIGANNWSTAVNWTNSTAGGFGAPTPLNDVIFQNNGTTVSSTATNNIVDGGFFSGGGVIRSLRYANTANYHRTLVSPNAALTISNNASGNALFVGTGADSGADATINAVIVGSALVVTNPNATINVRQGASSGSHQAILNLSALDNFDATVGRLLIAGDGGSGNADARLSGVLYLARTNVIRTTGTAPAVCLGDHPSNGRGNPLVPTQPSYLFLGQSNAIFTDSLTAGRQKAPPVSIRFNAAFVASDPVALFRGTGGMNSRVTTWSIGDNSALATSNQSTEGTNDFSGGTVDALIGTLFVGRGQTGAGNATGGSGSGVLTFDGGIIDVNQLEAGFQSQSGSLSAGIGAVNVNGAALLRVNSTLRLASSSGGTASSGTLNINGGTVEATNVAGGGGSSVINLNSGVLNLGPAWAPGAGSLANVSTLKVGAAGAGGSAVLTGARTISSANAITIASNGVISGNTTITSPGLIVNGTIAPGASVGSLTNNGPATFAPGGSYGFEVNDATAGPGAGWDYLRTTGDLNISATSVAPFTIRLQSLDEDDSGEALNFSSDGAYDWELLSAAGISGFDATKFAVNTAFFANDLQGGYFFIRADGSSLVLSFTNNHSPAATPLTLYRTGETLVIPIADLGANWSDPDGDPVELLEVTESSTNGLSNVSTDGTNIYYTAASAVPDAILYTVGDVRNNAPAIYRGGDTRRTAAGSIHILPQPMLGTVQWAGPELTISGTGGTAGGTYYVLTSTNMILPVNQWSIIATGLFDATGNFHFTNSITDDAPQHFYRLQLP